MRFTDPFESLVDSLRSLAFGRPEPPSAIGGEPYEPVDVRLSDFSSPTTFEEFDLAIYCAECDSVYSTYWDWQQHYIDSPSIETAGEAKAVATVLKPVDSEHTIGELTEAKPGVHSADEVLSTGKPSPRGSDERER